MMSYNELVYSHITSTIAQAAAEVDQHATKLLSSRLRQAFKLNRRKSFVAAAADFSNGYMNNGREKIQQSLLDGSTDVSKAALAVSTIQASDTTLETLSSAIVSRTNFLLERLDEVAATVGRQIVENLVVSNLAGAKADVDTVMLSLDKHLGDLSRSVKIAMTDTFRSVLPALIKQDETQADISLTVVGPDTVRDLCSTLVGELHTSKSLSDLSCERGSYLEFGGGFGCRHFVVCAQRE